MQVASPERKVAGQEKSKWYHQKERLQVKRKASGITRKRGCSSRERQVVLPERKVAGQKNSKWYHQKE
eukprot:233688-Pleurochrysis_carterae.AAC.1